MKHTLIKINLLVLFLAFCGIGMAQNLSNKGVDFWVGYGHHQFMETGGNNSQEMVIYLSAEQTANVTVRIEGTTWVRNYVVPAGTVIATEYMPKAGAIDPRLISLPCSFVPLGTPCGGVGTFCNKGIHITSDVPIVSYAHIFGSAASGATMLMPVETWGYAYVTLNSKQSYAANCFSWFYVIAQQDNTLIEVTPAATTRTGAAAGVPYTVLLNRGCIYQTMAGPEASSAKDEMTGSRIKSIANANGDCFPIAVFAGSSRTTNPAACGSGGGDNDNQQCFPVQSWGKRYLTAPTSNSATPSAFMTNTYKIAVKDPTSIVRRNGVAIPLASIINNTYYTFESNVAELIESDKPIMVAQFMTGGGCLGGGGGGDPEMMYISPVEQGIKRIGFYRNNRESITVNYLTLIIPTAGVSSLFIDGSQTFNHTYPHPNLAGYTVVIKRWGSAQAQAIAYSDSAFTAITYGLGSVESYGYNAGTLINNLSAVGSIFNVSDTSTVTTQHQFTCTKTPVKLSVLLGYPTPPIRLIWKLSLVGGGITPNADVTDNSPTPVGTQLVNGVLYTKYDLAGTYTFSSTGNFRIPIIATHPIIENCNNTEEVYYFIEVRDKPVANFSFLHTGCVLDSVYFSGQSPTSNGYNVNQWLWTFPDATTATIQNPIKRFLTPGIKAINLRVVSTEGCVSDTTKDVAISDKPIVDFTTTPPAVCEGTAITFTDNSSYTGTTPLNNSYWNFGDPGSGANNTSTLTSPTHTFSTYGTYNVKHTAGLGNSCIGDTVTKVVTVYAKPVASFNYPAGCLPATGVVQFTSTASTPDGQLITGHAWNFGDPASGVNNTSTLPNPTHAYPTFGNYTITYTATTANGCSKDTVVNATFNLAPTFSYPPLTSVCQNNAGTVSVATATVTNAVPGAGVYSGPGTSAAGVFDPSVAGQGTHTIWYVYTTTANCKDSVSQTISVGPTPNAGFAIPSAACLPASGIVSFNYTGTPLAGQTYLWNFGDPGSGANNTSTIANPSHTYATGTYSITLSITSNGCTKDSVVTNTFNVTPALAYPALAAVCESITGTVSVATATVTNGVPGTGVYTGTGVDAAGNFNPSAAGPGNHIITYTFTSTSGNCVATQTQTITVYAKPASSFTFPAAACLPTTGLVQFTYNGSLSAGQTYAWNFGDPASGALNTSTLQNPTHNYSNTGNHAISVTVTNTNGCVDDSVINTIFSVTPALAYPALTALCESVPGTVSVATATVTNAVSGTGVYSGPGVDAAGNFSPSAAGAGTHTMTYTFTSTGNCVATRTQTITVYAKPASSFTFPAAACLPTTGLVQFTYNGSLSAGQTYAWNFGDPASGALNTSTLQNPTHNYSNTGNHAISVTVTNTNGCVDDSVINTIFSVTPALAYPALTALCESVPGTVSVATATVTNSVSGTGVYSGPGVDAAGNFSPSAAGAGTHTMTYTFTSTGNCVATRTQTITVFAKPASSFTFPAAACLPTTGLVQFTYNGSLSAGQTYAWNFGDPASGALNTSTAQNPTHNYSNTGNHAISVTVTNTNGCVDDSVINTIFSVTPALAYPALTALCESVPGTVSVATATVTNAVSGTGVYSGPGVDAAGNFSPSAAGAGTHTMTYTFTSTGNCVATRTQTITVFAKPASSFTFPAAACLPTTGLVQFTYNGSLSAGQTYAWNFGDPASGALNTSTLQNPTHNYSNTGNHAISVTVTNTNGCVDDSVINTIFSVTPALAYPALTALCESVTGTVSVATATVTNSVSGTGVYSGPGVDAAGNFSPSAAGAGTHTMTYTFTSTGNCVAVITQPIKVNPKPNSVFNINNSICLGQQAQITDNSTIPSGNIVTWEWFFGDATTAINNNNNPFTKLYAAFGSYNVKLVTKSADGCISDTARQTILVNAIPVASFNMPASVCMPNGTASFTNTSTVADGTSLTYLWNFGDLSPNSTAVNPGHVYAAISSYNIKLTATSSSGCFKDSVQSFSAFFDKPIANFTVSPDKLCQGADNVFTDMSSAPNSTIKSRLWIFGDGSTSTEINPTIRYSKPGVYEVKLVVFNNENCISDTFRRTVTVYLQPVIDAGPSFIVPQGMPIQFKPIVNATNGISFLWTPPIGLSSPTVLMPNLVANADQTYVLMATGEGNCTATDNLFVKILRPVNVPNAFSPNGDGVNDTWIIKNLVDYPGAKVDVYNRYGQIIYTSAGYSIPWDGTIKGKPLPVATYYYIIKLENGFDPLSGSITIIR